MPARQRLFATASVLMSFAALTACEKPAPIVTLVNEGNHVYAEAGRWCFEGQTGEECATRNTEEVVLEVDRGVLGIDVDKELADGRWVATVFDPRDTSAPVAGTQINEDEHYATIDLPEIANGGSLVMVVRALEEGNDEEARGTWQFTLRPRA